MKDEKEYLSQTDDQVRGLIKKLEKIEAPKDFDFKVKAKIANAKPNRFSVKLWQSLAFGLPVIIVGLLLGFIVLKNNFVENNNPLAVQTSPSINKVTEVTPTSTISENITPQTTNELPSIAKNSKPESFQTQNEPKMIQQKSETVNYKPKNEIKVKPDKFTKKVVNNSREFTQEEATPSLFPKGLSPNSIKTNVNTMPNSKPIELKDVFMQFGIETEQENGNYKVKKLIPNSIGEKSGVKENDVIEGIDEKNITNQANSNKSITIKSLKILRAKQKLELKIKP